MIRAVLATMFFISILCYGVPWQHQLDDLRSRLASPRRRLRDRRLIIWGSMLGITGNAGVLVYGLVGQYKAYKAELSVDWVTWFGLFWVTVMAIGLLMTVVGSWARRSARG